MLVAGPPKAVTPILKNIQHMLRKDTLEDSRLSVVVVFYTPCA